MILAAFFGDSEADAAYGIGAAYDLGGGASVVGGYVETDSIFGDTSAFDLGLSFSF